MCLGACPRQRRPPGPHRRVPGPGRSEHEGDSGGYRGGRYYGGRYYGGRYYGWGGAYVGWPSYWWGPAYYGYYGYPAYTSSYTYYDAYPAYEGYPYSTYYDSADTYVEPPVAAAPVTPPPKVQYYCPDAGYYPAVPACPRGWQRVPSDAPPR